MMMVRDLRAMRCICSMHAWMALTVDVELVMESINRISVNDSLDLGWDYG